jgi:acyl-CoA dehydrogenase
MTAPQDEAPPSISRFSLPPPPAPTDDGAWFDRLLRGPFEAEPCTGIDAFYTRLEAADRDAPEGSVERAAIGGFLADRLGYAFVAGYRAALVRLVPELSRGSLCATESGGGHPRFIRTTLTEAPGGGFTLHGTKTFATLASAATTLLVVASTGEGEDGRNRLQVAAIPRERAGVVVRDKTPLPFAPEISHAEVQLENVAVSPEEVLLGDGYADVLKPFRTYEDTGVMAATLGHLVRLGGLLRFPRAQREEALATLLALRGVASHDPRAPSTHLVLAGVQATLERLVNEANLRSADPDTQIRWDRDRPLLQVAASIRQKRREVAWSAYLRDDDEP